MRYRMTKGYAWATLFVALALTLPTLMGIVSDAAERSKIQRRPLAQWPAAGLLMDDPRAYFSGVNEYLHDNAAPVIWATKTYRRFLVETLHTSPSPDIVLGDAPFIFFDSYKNSGPASIFASICPKILDEQAVSTLKADVRKLASRFAGKDRRGLAVIIPTKPSLYGDRLPPSVPAADRALCAEHITGRNALLSLDLASPGGILVYPYREMALRRDEPHFYPPEEFHNSGLSGRLIAEKVFKAVGIKVAPEYTNAVKVPIEVEGDLATILGYDKTNQDWFFDDYTPFGLSQAFKSPEAIGSIHKNAYDWRTFTVAKPMSERKALVLGDSFGAKNALQLAAGYRKLLQININGIEHDEFRALKKYLDAYDFDDVFFIMSDDDAFRLIPYLNKALDADS